MKKKAWMTVLLSVMLTGCATQQERAERMAETRKAVNEAVEKRQWNIDVNSMHTMRYGSKMVSSDFSLELRNDTLISYLPYLGQAQRAPMMSPSQGLNFVAPVLHYRQQKKKEHQYEIEIDVRTQEDTYKYWIELFDTGEASIRVNANNRDPIDFGGSMSVSLPAK